ncbi:MAG: ribulose-phosphate 3-epimerase [Flavobacteriales bacterium]|nr:ribulose-phosphate 3-epimerase [Flavobacteriales bacterium]MBK7086567.1 ribulose-phosphate 3-epimerase [Flavobacteriales bacterium]MBK7269300.1 ribulose-phosphate 3-epimerase [Flavobacteriales bacterium]MBK7753901.1 ribulose-phosphate 3-epimerase [Flavobacteriales bacterium]MBK9077344.1 ribulose-phosphate 3-epimerase [Flavobacteriales bacterium]
MAHLVAPSLLAADFTDLKSAVRMVDESVAPWLHLDVMDGVFVPNISFGPLVIQAIRPLTRKIFDVHLMIVRPDQYISAFRDAGAQVLTVHFEVCPHLHRTLLAIKAAGMKAGVAINPHTPVHTLEDVLAETDLVCMMSVNPGFGGQKFIEHTYTKLAALKALRSRTGSQALIEIDGGVSAANAAGLVAAGADVLVAGNSVFAAEAPQAAIAALSAV